jgi:hypothetical protein
MPSAAKGGIVALAILVVGAVAALFVVALTDDRELAFTLGVQPSQTAVVVAPGERACQRPIDTSAAARQVSFKTGTFRRPGPALAVEARSAGGEPARGTVPAGYGDLTWQTVALDRPVPEGRRIELCIANRGERAVALFGAPAQAARTSSAYEGGRELPTDIALVFERGSGRSALALIPTIFERAALWHPGWAGEWLFWVLAIAALFAVPLLLAGALKAAVAATTAPPGTHPQD